MSVTAVASSAWSGGGLGLGGRGAEPTPACARCRLVSGGRCALLHVA